MANLMKLCKKCVKWTAEDVTKCQICGSQLVEARLSSIYWGKISEEEKRHILKNI